MKKLFSFLYPLCWICLCWGVLAAMPDALLSSLTQGSETGASPSWLMPLVGVLMCVLLLLLVQLVLSMTPQRAGEGHSAQARILNHYDKAEQCIDHRLVRCPVASHNNPAKG